ncbi:hypothetical protein FKG94_15405 [Exilibacterium tricleocarpae]|uniref:Uncharacterized protein n=1 Tax=Exilibacterium tricleocarpae TaxID=2591008 RepID=A0A545TFM0_9GAMM|nr:hypothetical protein [Exilibacterium tricleocarpae]TQV75995.1 hypothetical protein FKG94_15405 [Exilibacterium tricleocarpae]
MTIHSVLLSASVLLAACGGGETSDTEQLSRDADLTVSSVTGSRMTVETDEATLVSYSLGLEPLWGLLPDAAALYVYGTEALSSFRLKIPPGD